MSRTNFVTVKLKNLIIPITFVLFTIFLVVFSKSNLSAAKEGLSLFANSVLPSLLPFFIATELLSYTGIIEVLGRTLNRFMRPIFNVPGVGAFAFIMGIISGYPLLAFTNNSGPLFIIGTVGISLFFDTRTGILLFLSHILACISVGIVFRFWKRNNIKRACNALPYNVCNISTKKYKS